MVIASATRRLPGFRFEVQLPPLREVLPRMDIALFVGFAASGPLHLPVAMEDAAQFAAIFGDDAPLAWDARRGEPVYAYLAPAVRAFFANGGRRCWVVRVADQEQADTNLFPIPGLAQARVVDGKVKAITPALARARSPGSWSDAWKVSATMSSQSVSILVISSDGILVTAAVASALLPGDLLRLTYCDEGYTLFFLVREIQSLPVSLPESGQAFQVIGTAAWFQSVVLASPPLAVTAVHHFSRTSGGEVIPVIGLPTPAAGGTTTLQLQRPCGGLLPDEELGAITLTLPLPLAEAPPPGSLLRADSPAGQWWLLAQDIRGGEDVGSPPQATVEVSGQAVQWLEEPPEPWPASEPVVERLTFELWAHHGQADGLRLPDLAFGPAHPRFWGALPDDEQLFQPPERAMPHPLWPEAARPRFPLAGPETTQRESFTFPLAMLILPELFLAPLPQIKMPLERDGLATFAAGLFLDAALADVTTADVMNKADFIRYQSSQPRPLTGIHAALAVEEATLIAVPDAAHLGWQVSDPPEAPAPKEVPPLARPAWWRSQRCDPARPVPPTAEPEWGNFLNCDIRLITPPTLSHDTPDSSGSFTIFWESAEPGAWYILEESTSPDFTGPVTIYEGTATQLALYGRSPGAYYYHVRLEVGPNSSDWSPGVVVQVLPIGRYQLKDPTPAVEETLATIHRALLRLCAARGDLLAILCLPEHYREKEAISYPAFLQPTSTPTFPGAGTLFTLPLGFGETRALTYGALYHPWLIGQEAGQLRRTPPDGAVCGLIARRTLARGAWVAPANERLNGVVALTPAMARDYWLSLQEAQINLVRQEPYGFVSLSANTLSLEAELRPINVRRLLILLRRLALKLGATYVFEPYDDVFQRMVQRGFESLLDDMFVRGAFAGKTAASSYQVVVRSTPQDRDQGRFIVELRVAPSQPLTFLIVRLVQSGDRSLVTEGTR